jgi:ketosteroid isomerase-like protein
MPETPSPRDVLDQLHQGISEGRWDEIFELYAEDVVIDIPLAKPEPDHIEGIATVRKRFADAGRGPLELRVVGDTVVHETTDPEVIIAEWDYEGRATDTGRTFRVSNVQVLRVRDGLIVESRDYHDHFGLAAATGNLPKLVEALSPQD